MSWAILRADAKQIPIKDQSVDAIVTDPPYGLKFMSQAWDHGVPGVPFWLEALRVLKAGGYLLAFGGTRTFHRLTCGLDIDEVYPWSARRRIIDDAPLLIFT